VKTLDEKKLQKQRNIPTTEKTLGEGEILFAVCSCSSYQDCYVQQFSGHYVNVRYCLYRPEKKFLKSPRTLFMQSKASMFGFLL